MKWHLSRNLSTYASLMVAVVGLSALSTLMKPTPTVAQETRKSEDEASLRAKIRELDALERELAKIEKGADVADVQRERESLFKKLKAETEAMADAMTAKAKAASEQAATIRESKLKAAGELRAQAIVQEPTGGTTSTYSGTSRKAPSPRVSGSVTVAQDDNVITEELRGATQRIIVKQNPDGTQSQEIALVREPSPYWTEEVKDNIRYISPRAMYGVATAKQAAELTDAMNQLKKSDLSEEAKTAALEKVSSILSEQFDKDLEQRVKQVEELEKQVQSLKQQIAKRRDAKKRLVDLRIELLKNESEGLGFPSSWQTQPSVVVPGQGPMTLNGNILNPAVWPAAPTATWPSGFAPSAPALPPPPAVAPTPSAPVAPPAPAAASAPAPAAEPAAEPKR